MKLNCNKHLCVNGIYYTELARRIKLNDILREIRQNIEELRQLRQNYPKQIHYDNTTRKTRLARRNM